MIEEVYRVLKPGGKVLAVTPAYYDVDYWVRTLFLLASLVSASPRQESAPLQTSPVGRQPGQTSCSQRFTEIAIRKRQLRRPEVPHVWRWIPLPILARLMGRVLVLKAFKPVNVGMQK